MKGVAVVVVIVIVVNGHAVGTDGSVYRSRELVRKLVGRRRVYIANRYDTTAAYR